MELRRTLGPLDVVLFFVVASSNLQWVATAAAGGPSSLGMWVLGGLAMFVPLSICVISLMRQIPDEGGMYVWSKRAFGPFAGFFTGWTYWTSNLPYFSALLYFAAGNALYAGGGGSTLAQSAWYFIGVSLAGLAIATVVNLFGYDVGKWLNNVGAVARWIVTLALIGLGAFAWWKLGPAMRMNAGTIRPGMDFKNVLFLSVIAFAWTGPEAIAFVGGEIRNPRRTVPLGLAIAAPAIGAIYIAGTAAVLAILPAHDVNVTSGVMQAIAAASARIGWSVFTPVAAVLVAISCVGSCGAWLGAMARIPFVAGIDKYLPPAFGKMHPKWGSPVAPLLAQAAIAAVFVVLGQGGSSVKGAYDVLVGSTVVITMLPFMLLFAAAIKLQATRGAIPFVAAIGLVTTVVAAILAVFPAADDPNKPLAVAKVLLLTLLLAGAGVLVYAYGRRRYGGPGSPTGSGNRSPLNAG